MRGPEPKPNGAGSALRNTSSAVKSPASAASWWKYIHRFWVCTTHLGIPVVPDVELTRNTSSGPYARPASVGAGRVRVGGDAVVVDDHVVQQWAPRVPERGDEVGSRPAAVLGERDERVGAR